MPIITSIPERYKIGFDSLIEISDEIFSSIEDALKEVASCSSNIELAEIVAELKKLDVSKVRNIFFSVGELFSLLEDESDIEQIIDDLVNLFAGKDFLSAEDEAKFRARILILLHNKKIFYSSKASDLITESGNVFLTSRIITDIRPIFDLDIEKSTEAAIILHNLHIHYQDSSHGMHKEFYISLTSRDLQSLLDSIYRAEKKEENLQSIFIKSGMTNIIE